MKEKNKISKDKKPSSDNLSVLGSSEIDILEKMHGINILVRQGYSENEIAKKYLSVCPETFSRLKARNKTLKDSIDNSITLFAIESLQKIIDVMNNSPQEKLQLQAAIYLDEKHTKLKNQTNTPMNISISFQNPSLSKTKEQIEKDLEQDLKHLNET